MFPFDVVPDVVPELEELPVLSFEEVSDFLLVELSVLLPEVLSVLLPASVLLLAELSVLFSGEELDMKKEQVLLIEDDADIREGVRILLESENYCVEEAENGKSGLELLSDETDLVILDIMMPGMSGLRTCEEIRKVSNVPVLFLTAKAQESDKLIGLMAGGDDYLAKPFSYAELLGRVKALLRRYNIYRGRNNEVREEAEPYLRR